MMGRSGGTNPTPFLLGLALTLGLSHTATARADDAPDPYSLSPEQLFGATVISASKSPESLWDTAAAVFVITGADIERAGVTSIPEALRLAPGVQVARVNESGWAISVRGFAAPLANKLLVLIDGREIYDPLFSGVYWDVQDTALEDIERIEVVRGPGASLWGANAVNGVINIITKSATQTQGLLVAATGGTEERAGLTVRYGGEMSTGAAWRVYGKYFERNGMDTLAGRDANGDWGAWRGGFRVDGQSLFSGELTLQGDIYRSESGQMRSVPLFVDPYAILEREDITAQGANILARWTRDFSGGRRLTAQAYLDRTQRTQRTLEDRRTTFDVDTQYEFGDLGPHQLIAGARYRLTSDVIDNTPIVFSEHRTNRQDMLSAFVQDHIALTPEHWRLTLGSKFEHNDFTGFEVQPNIRLQWLDGETQTVWGAISRAVRTPSELERDFNAVLVAGPFGNTGLPITLELRPNPEFVSEELTAYEIGYRRQITPSVQIDLTTFYNDYDKLTSLTGQPFELALDPLRVAIPIIAENGAKAKTYGGEAALNWRATDALNLSMTYSLLKMDITGPADGIDTEAPEDRAPRNQLNLRAQWDISDALSLDVIGYHVDKLRNYDVDAYNRLDMRIGWGVTDNVQIDLVGQNLLDNTHVEFGPLTDAAIAEVERSAYIKLTWRP